MAETGVLELTSQEHFETFVKSPKLVVIHFFAEWASECQPMNEVLDTLSKEDELKGVMFAKIPAENFPKISMQCKISAVPTFLFYLAGKQVDRLDGANAAKLTQMVKNNNAKAQTLEAASAPVLSGDVKPVEAVINTKSTAGNSDEILKKLINQAPVMLFMKGNAENPQCGFSRQAVAILKELKAEFGTFDIFTDEKVRQDLKIYSKWPTYPQLYIKGELIGGLDIMKEMVASGDLAEMLPKTGTLEERLKQLTNKAPLMAFIKGDRHVPKCGFTRQLIEILNDTKCFRLRHFIQYRIGSLHYCVASLSSADGCHYQTHIRSKSRSPFAIGPTTSQQAAAAPKQRTGGHAW
ncbi:glutaredoxin-3-like isoform X2 [Daphnia pulex]|uniref:glutaredoxin-3-like isoform X2 n=1 Tax=Daphnia pulex TaxID=6669 RepID=UPI001EDE679E|nr:glutaredoxin-3-like isoform X2 [Daphnia pulex]